MSRLRAKGNLDRKVVLHGAVNSAYPRSAAKPASRGSALNQHEDVRLLQRCDDNRQDLDGAAVWRLVRDVRATG
jgi:hypothetical protein